MLYLLFVICFLKWSLSFFANKFLSPHLCYILSQSMFKFSLLLPQNAIYSYFIQTKPNCRACLASLNFFLWVWFPLSLYYLLNETLEKIRKAEVWWDFWSWGRGLPSDFVLYINQMFKRTTAQISSSLMRDIALMVEQKASCIDGKLHSKMKSVNLLRRLENSSNFLCFPSGCPSIPEQRRIMSGPRITVMKKRSWALGRHGA